MKSKEAKNSDNRQSLKVKGYVLSPGKAIGTIFHYRDILTRDLETRFLKDSELEDERLRIQQAFKKVKRYLMRMSISVKKELDEKHAAIFQAQQEILDDPMINADIEKELREQRLNGEHVVREVLRLWENRFATLDNEEMKQRGHDIADLGKHLIRTLIGEENSVLAEIPQGSVVVTERLLPSDTLQLKKERVSAIITSQGGHNSHAAILARSLNIPLISQPEVSLSEIKEGAKIIVDADQNTLILNPSLTELAEYEKEIACQTDKRDKLLSEIKSKKSKLKREAVCVYANVSSPEDIELAEEMHCDGIGLFRLEQIYMMKHLLPTEEIIYKDLRRSLSEIKRKVITMRLLDIGGDKIIPYLKLPEQKESMLGLRGVRLLLKYESLLRSQLRVLLRLNALFNLQVLVPMVSVPEDMIRVKRVLKEEVDNLQKKHVDCDSNIRLGAMIENPAAVLMLPEILRHSDFISIGSNDLIQYTMAADREKASVASYYETGAEVVMPWLKEILRSSHSVGKECTLCGELASDPNYIEKLLSLGFKHFSVTPRFIPNLRKEALNFLLR